jgi:hypothetical protein
VLVRDRDQPHTCLIEQADLFISRLYDTDTMDRRLIIGGVIVLAVIIIVLWNKRYNRCHQRCRIKGQNTYDACNSSLQDCLAPYTDMSKYENIEKRQNCMAVADACRQAASVLESGCRNSCYAINPFIRVG